MLVDSKTVLHQAKSGNYAVPAPNFFDIDSARAYVELASEKKLPLILAYAEVHQDMLSLEEAALIGKYFATKVETPVVLHLDHGVTESLIKKAVDLGFTSVMIDASKDSFEENVRRTKEIVDYAHARGVSVEAEIGHVGAGLNYENHEKTDSIYTEVDAAIKFVEKTNVDSLAISIGTAHGLYKGVPKINFERLKELNDSLSVPLVLHGGSSSGDDNLGKCAVSGISKINIFTDLIVGSMKCIKKEKPEDYFSLKKYANSGMKEVLEHYYEVFKCKHQ